MWPCGYAAANRGTTCGWLSGAGIKLICRLLTQFLSASTLPPLPPTCRRDPLRGTGDGTCLPWVGSAPRYQPTANENIAPPAQQMPSGQNAAAGSRFNKGFMLDCAIRSEKNCKPFPLGEDRVGVRSRRGGGRGWSGRGLVRRCIRVRCRRLRRGRCV